MYVFDAKTLEISYVYIVLFLLHGDNTNNNMLPNDFLFAGGM